MRVAVVLVARSVLVAMVVDVTLSGQVRVAAAAVGVRVRMGGCKKEVVREIWRGFVVEREDSSRGRV